MYILLTGQILHQIFHIYLFVKRPLKEIFVSLASFGSGVIHLWSSLVIIQYKYDNAKPKFDLTSSKALIANLIASLSPAMASSV